MQLDESKDVLHVATDDYELVKELLGKFNKIHKTELRYKESVDVDGVMFSYLDAKDVSIDKIFLFGVMFGSKLRELSDARKSDRSLLKR